MVGSLGGETCPREGHNFWVFREAFPRRVLFLLVRWAGNKKWKDPDLNNPTCSFLCIPNTSLLCTSKFWG